MPHWPRYGVPSNGHVPQLRVHAAQACQAAFNLQADVKTCDAVRNGSCLTAAQKSTVSAVFAGGKTGNGQAMQSSFPYDPGLADSDWVQWKFVNSLALDPLATGAVSSVPPGPVDPLAESIDARLPMFSATNAVYQESGLQLMLPVGQDNPVNLMPLRARGAKMVLYHGVSDAIFSADDTRRWMERLVKAGVNASNDFARYFPVPGMNHCSGGLAADQMDLLTPSYPKTGHLTEAIRCVLTPDMHTTKVLAMWRVRRAFLGRK